MFSYIAGVASLDQRSEGRRFLVLIKQILSNQLIGLVVLFGVLSKPIDARVSSNGVHPGTGRGLRRRVTGRLAPYLNHRFLDQLFSLLWFNAATFE